MLVILFTSCKKHTQVSGTVYDASSKPVPFANISIYSESDGGWNITTTDSKGYYILYFKATKKAQYTVSAYKPIADGVSSGIFYHSKSVPISIGKSQVIDLYP